MNIKVLTKVCLVGIIAVFSGGQASADVYDLTFTAAGATITGGIVFDKSATDFSIISLISTDLTIEGLPYSITDLHFFNNDGPNVIICTTPRGPPPGCAVDNATNEFAIRYSRTTGAFTDFSLGTPFSGTDSGTTTFTRLIAVPGPIVGAGLPGLIFAGGGLLGWWRRKRKALAAA